MTGESRGFTMIELVVAMAIVLAITAGVFSAVQTSPEIVATQAEAADVQQRTRVAVDALLRDLVSATSVVPYRWGGASADPPGSFKTDTITAVAAARSVTYWLKTDVSAGTFQLTSWSGGSSADVPVVDNVVAFDVALLAEGSQPLSAAELSDGPWLPDATSPSRLDADLQRVHTVALTLRVQAASPRLRGPAGEWFVRAGTATSARQWVPDLVTHLRIAPRNLNRER